MTPNNDEVICPNCAHQFRAIPQNVQQLMLDVGFKPPFTTPPQRTWVGMSEEEKIQFMVAYYSSNWDTKTLIAVMDNYEAQLRSKNTRGKE